MSKIIEKMFTLTEILVKTTYQVVISKDMSFQKVPIAFGSGFFINYKNKLFFITADHNIHIEDHKQNLRTGVENHVAILNNINDKKTLSTILTPIGGFYYMEKFDISKEDLNPELVDVAISLIDRTKFQAQFLTNEDIKDGDTKLVSPNEQKLEFLEEHITEPQETDLYYVFGKIKPNLNGLVLYSENTFKNDLKYRDTYYDFILLNATEDIVYEEWAGLSGSPVINQDGKCIGVLCSVNDGLKSVFVKPFSKIKPFLDTIILQEQIENK